MRRRVPYRRVVIDASVANNRFEVEPPDSPVAGVEVRALPGALASVELHFGLDADPVLVRQGSRVKVPPGADPLGAGVFLTSGVGGAGTQITLLIYTEDHRRLGPAFEVIDP